MAMMSVLLVMANKIQNLKKFELVNIYFMMVIVKINKPSEGWIT